jgi:hypothetical protein
MALETDDFLDGIRTVLLAGIPELSDEKSVVVWHSGESDPDEDVKAGMMKTKGVSVLIYDTGGDTEGDDDTVGARVNVELYVDTTKRNRRKNPDLRYGSQIRTSIMRLLHRNRSLRNVAVYFDCRVKGYEVLSDPEFAAWRITLAHNIYLETDP